MAQWRSDTKKLDGSNLVSRYEVMMLSDQLTASGTLTDAFGRLRTSQGFTLFDSSHRYQENSKWAAETSGTANSQFRFHESAVDLNISATSGDRVYRETRRVFSYQPGKGLLVMNTFAMNPAKEGLRQRVGYFSANNGVYFENKGANNYFVLRSYSNGSLSETRVPQVNWNVDKFDGTGYSAQAPAGVEHSAGLDITKGNILWSDVEWLGVGDVRCGFVVDGKFVVGHVFHNDNVGTTTYMTTASLPCRYEIENLSTTSSPSTMKQICSTVISEGGYELSGVRRSVVRALNNPKDIPTAGTFVPIISVRLKDSFQDAICVLKDVEFFGLSNNTRYIYTLIVGGTLTGASWSSVNANSPVEYDFSASAVSGGRNAFHGYLNTAAQGERVVQLSGDNLFSYQFERNPFSASNKGTIFTLAATGAGNGDDAIGTIAWEEI